MPHMARPSSDRRQPEDVVAPACRLPEAQEAKRAAGREQQQQDPGFGMVEEVADDEHGVAGVALDQTRGGLKVRDDALVEVGGVEPGGVGAVGFGAVAVDAG